MRRSSTSGTETLLLRLFVALLALLFLAACSPRRSYEAALVLSDIAAGEKPSRLKRITPVPTRSPVAFSVEGRSYGGDLYRPGEAAMAGILLVPGAAERGKDDPRLVAFATSLARARFNVLVPDLESLRTLRVNPGNIGEVADTFFWLASEPGLAPGGRAGMAAFSYAAGPVVLAAMDPRIRGRTRFILAVGGYYDLERVLAFFTTGYFQKGEELHYLEPNEYGKWVFVLSNADLLSKPSDRRILSTMAGRKMEDLEADLSDLAEKLGPEGLSVYAFIVNREPDRADELLEGLPEAVRSDIAALNLAEEDLSRLKARLILIHGFDDNIIPYTESIALAKAAPRGQAKLFLADGLAHVDLKPGLLSRWRLWRAIDALLAERER